MLALVTGASRGIGRAVALELAARGASVAVGYHHNAHAAEDLVAAIRQSGGSAVPMPLDVRDHEAVAQVFRSLDEQPEPLEILVCCAGVTRDVLLVASESADFDSVLRVRRR